MMTADHMHWTGDRYIELKYIVKCNGRVRMWPLWAGDHYTKVTVTVGFTVFLEVDLISLFLEADLIIIFLEDDIVILFLEAYIIIWILSCNRIWVHQIFSITNDWWRSTAARCRVMFTSPIMSCKHKIKSFYSFCVTKIKYIMYNVQD